ncbi:cation transporting ATPase C-terminal domain-containing protein [Synechococcus sp. CBW1006]|uniref:cation transporting ATPase C-terminal domain-containing protein n=1 Tax=Synechococcus sp. CBW1006 TaxID=1353138 RepID=UPI001E607F3B|nr:cation transporting ATPase C-terminal domain-containing protein [Synechococcus sp. CBW1006]
MRSIQPWFRCCAVAWMVSATAPLLAQDIPIEAPQPATEDIETMKEVEKLEALHFAPTTTVQLQINGALGALHYTGSAIETSSNTAAGAPLLNGLSFNHETRLTIDTSVTGQDLLRIRFRAGNFALLHLVIDPACTVVFEALPATPGLMRQPPRPPQAPLFGPDTWRHSLSQGAVVMVAALVLVFWPDTDTATHRSLVFSLLLLAGGGLVWLNGDPHSRITAAGAGIGLGLWLLLLAIPGLQQLLSLAPMQPAEILTVMITTAVALLLAGLLNRQLA